MSEQLMAEKFSRSPEDQLAQSSFEAFNAQINHLATTIPEIEQRPEIAEAGAQLIDQFGITESLFVDEARSLVFMAIASHAVDTQHMSGDDRVRSSEFVADSLTVLAHKHSTKLSEASALLAQDDSRFDDATCLRVYEKYTDRSLSQQVTQKIAEGFLSEVKKKLGVTADNEDPYEIRVLSIGGQSEVMGLDAPRPDYSLPFNHPDMEAAVSLQRDVKQWKSDLEVRGSMFIAEMGKKAEFAPAWMTELGGTRFLCISSGLAEKICDPNVTENTPWYTADHLERDLAILAHEYTHTQGGIMVDGEVAFGINLEELRAEHFSGNKQGYAEIKTFFQSYGMITGQDVKAGFNVRLKGGSTLETFGPIANRIGLSKMLEVMMAAPDNYIALQSNRFLRGAYAYIGGLDGVLRSIYEAEVARGNQSKINERVTKFARTVMNNGIDLGFFETYRKKKGIVFTTDLVVRRIKELQSSE